MEFDLERKWIQVAILVYPRVFLFDLFCFGFIFFYFGVIVGSVLGLVLFFVLWRGVFCLLGWFFCVFVLVVGFFVLVVCLGFFLDMNCYLLNPDYIKDI